MLLNHVGCLQVEAHTTTPEAGDQHSEGDILLELVKRHLPTGERVRHRIALSAKATFNFPIATCHCGSTPCGAMIRVPDHHCLVHMQSFGG